MKCINILHADDKIVITTQTESSLFGFFKKVKTRKFEAIKEYPSGYWDWLELPNHALIPDVLRHQLNAWCNRKSDKDAGS